MLREWRHLQLLKRGGRAHVQTGVGGTSPGELAVLCPACPHPNINLPKNWTSMAKEFEYVFRFSLTPYVPTTAANVSKGISTISALGSTRVSVSSDVKFPPTSRIWNSALGLRMSSHGSHTANTFVTTPLRTM